MRPKTGSVDQHRGSWRARVTLGGKRVELGHYPTEEEAWQAVEAAHQAAVSGRAVTSQDATLRTLGTAWLAQRKRGGIADARGEERRWKRHVLGHAIADRPVRILTTPDVEVWLADVAAATSRETANRCLSLVRGCLRSAQGRHVKANPCAGARLPGRRSKAVRWTYLEPAEQTRLLTCAEVPEDDRIIIGVAIGTGIRQGELVALERSDVHLDGDYPYLDITKSRKRDVTKSGKPRRVPLFGLGLQAMTRWLELHPCERGLVFPAARGGMRSAGHVLGQVDERDEKGKRTRKLCRWPLLLAQAGVRRVRWHDLRHTCASSLVSGWWGAPWPLEQVAELLGDTMAAAAIYAHLGPSTLREAADRTGWVTPDSNGGKRKRRKRETPSIFGVGQPGLEPGTDGLKGPRPVPDLAEKGSGEQDRPRFAPETLAARVLVALARGDVGADRLAVELAEAVLGAAAGEREETG